MPDNMSDKKPPAYGPEQKGMKPSREVAESIRTVLDSDYALMKERWPELQHVTDITFNAPGKGSATRTLILKCLSMIAGELAYRAHMEHLPKKGPTISRN